MALGDTCPREANKGARCPRLGDNARPGGDRSSPRVAGPSRARTLRPKMPRPSQLLSLLVLLVLAATARGQTSTGPKVLQPWLLGITAVVVFLFIVFVVLVINRFWNLRRRRKQSDYPETTEPDRLERFGHVNPAAENSDEESDGKERTKATSL
ncbi:small integral membrane protein 24 [Myiozetetes cayanensis]|uniref:small integral membrane protein 24 n=1 Tax=Myiozetetes cayanensis TaxID=478635 RepID=UPI0021606859|nr:small integral membrane protein 24 [Myiozetetes cayanensis]